MKACQFPMTATLIRHARLKSGLKQSEFIEKHNLEVTQATFSRWETGQAQAPFEVLIKLGVIQPINIF